MNPNPPPTAASAVSNGALRAAAHQPVTNSHVALLRIKTLAYRLRTAGDEYNADIAEMELKPFIENLTAKDAAVSKVLAAWDRKAGEHHKAAKYTTDRVIREQLESIAITYEICAKELRALHQPDDNEE